MPGQSGVLSGGGRPTRGVGDKTRHALLRAGERLFSARGIDGPSLREITAAAGGGNKSALQYHFGSRDGLVLGIIAEHGEVLRVRHALAFERLVLDDATDDLHRLCDVFVRPYAEFLRDGPSQWAYLVISAAVLDSPQRRYEDLQVLFNDPLVPRLVELLLQQLDLPEALAAERVLVATSQVIAAIATRARQQLAGPSERVGSPLPLFIANAVDMMVGALTAPVSSGTRAVIDEEAFPVR